MRLCIILGKAGAADPGIRRLLSWLDSDSRFETACVTAAPGAPPNLPPLVRAVLAVERKVFPAPNCAAPRPVKPVPFSEALSGRYDVVVDFSHAPGALAMAARARHGVWRSSAHAPGAGLAEARDRMAVSCATLTRHAPDGGAAIIATAPYDTKFLASRNAAFLRETSAALLRQALSRLAETGAARPVDAPPAALRPMGARDVPGYLFRTKIELGRRALRAAAKRLGQRPGMFFLHLTNGTQLDFDPAAGTDLIPPKGAFWADPFLFEENGALFLFYEEFDYRSERGHLRVGRLEGDRMVPLGVALKRPYHLSYPFVFRWNDEILMVPESLGARRLEIWRATDFPTGWELASVALDGIETADTVVFETDGQWWMFTNIGGDSFGSFASDLHLFKIDSPLMNEVTPHPLNPVVIDTTTARGGGRVFAQDGRLYRASQNNSHGTYGFGLNIMEITRLDETGYEERPVRRVLPNFSRSIMGCHHVDSAAGRVVIDVRTRYLGGPDLGRGQDE